MQCCEKKKSENIKDRRKIYAARDFSDKYDHALFKISNKICENPCHFFKKIKSISNLICILKNLAVVALFFMKFSLFNTNFSI
jgi:hypothetical protein